MEEAFYEHSNWDDSKAVPYFVKGSTELLDMLSSEQTKTGITATALGFYGPQGRFLRLRPNPFDINEILAGFEYRGQRITNFEMESSALFALSKALGHRATTICLALANRPNGDFMSEYNEEMKELIKYVLNEI